MPISRELRVIFVHVAKAGGTAVRRALGMPDAGPELEHAGARRLRELYPLEWATYSRLIVVRHPVARFMSSLRYAQAERSDFHDADRPHIDHERLRGKTAMQALAMVGDLQHPGFRPQVQYLFGMSREEAVRVEALPALWPILLDRMRVSYRPLLPANVTPGPRPTPCARCARAIARHYAEDMRVLGYA